jgi:hypothetical protein
MRKRDNATYALDGTSVKFCRARFTLRVSYHNGRDRFMLYPLKSERWSRVFEIPARHVQALLDGTFDDPLTVLRVATEERMRDIANGCVVPAQPTLPTRDIWRGSVNEHARVP